MTSVDELYLSGGGGGGVSDVPVTGAPLWVMRSDVDVLVVGLVWTSKQVLGQVQLQAVVVPPVHFP